MQNALARAMELSVSGRPLVAVGAVNALAARVVSEAGFDALWISGLEVSTALGLPDRNVLTPQDLSAVVLACRRVTSIPIVVDIDNGGGSIDATTRFAQELSGAGATAVCIEDSRYPKVNSFSSTRQALCDPQLTSSQVSRVRDVAPDMFVIARTESLVAGESLETAMSRTAEYRAAGSSASLIHSRDATGQELVRIGMQWEGNGPIVCVPTSTPHLSTAEIGEAGYHMVIYANQLSRLFLAHAREALEDFRRDDRFDPASLRMASMADLLNENLDGPAPRDSPAQEA